MLISAMACLNLLGDGHGIGPRQEKDGNIRRRVAVDFRKGAVGLLAEFDPGHIAHAHDLRLFGAAGTLDDDIFELLHVGQTAQGVDGKLEDLVGRRRRAAHLTGHHLDILALDGIDHVQGRTG